MVERGVARKLSQAQAALDIYEGPKFYLSHHEVLKPDSESTPCRIVFNLSVNFKGHVLSDYRAKGPDMLNTLLEILIRFRENQIAMTGYIKKMDHAVKISEQDQHTHRFLWRDMDSTRNPDTYVVTPISFGDRSSGNIAIMALQKTAELKKNKYPQAASMILDNFYVDDIVNSIKDKDEANKLTRQANHILNSRGFAVKHWTISDPTQNPNTNLEQQTTTNESFKTISEGNAIFKGIEKTEQKVLGLHWDQSSDNFQFAVKLNFSPRRRKVYTGPNLSLDQIPKSMPTILTKGKILSQINGIYDPLGLAKPFTMKAKLLMRHLSNVEGKGLDWDNVPSKLNKDWICFFKELFDMERISLDDASNQQK